MSYAIRKDGQGWRSIDNIEDVYENETFSSEQPIIKLVDPTYAQLRLAAYPPMQDLIDGLVKDDAAQVQKYKDDCLAVKALYPKP